MQYCQVIALVTRRMGMNDVFDSVILRLMNLVLHVRWPCSSTTFWSLPRHGKDSNIPLIDSNRWSTTQQQGDNRDERNVLSTKAKLSFSHNMALYCFYIYQYLPQWFMHNKERTLFLLRTSVIFVPEGFLSLTCGASFFGEHPHFFLCCASWESIPELIYGTV